MRELTFLAVYSLVLGCVAFTVVHVFSLPPWPIVIVTMAGIRLADRVGLGFGVQPFGRYFAKKPDADTEEPRSSVES